MFAITYSDPFWHDNVDKKEGQWLRIVLVHRDKSPASYELECFNTVTQEWVTESLKPKLFYSGYSTHRHRVCYYYAPETHRLYRGMQQLYGKQSVIYHHYYDFSAQMGEFYLKPLHVKLKTEFPEGYQPVFIGNVPKEGERGYSSWEAVEKKETASHSLESIVTQELLVTTPGYNSLTQWQRMQLWFRFKEIWEALRAEAASIEEYIAALKHVLTGAPLDDSIVYSEATQANVLVMRAQWSLSDLEGSSKRFYSEGGDALKINLADIHCFLVDCILSELKAHRAPIDDIKVPQPLPQYRDQYVGQKNSQLSVGLNQFELKLLQLLCNYIHHPHNNHLSQVNRLSGYQSLKEMADGLSQWMTQTASYAQQESIAKVMDDLAAILHAGHYSRINNLEARNRYVQGSCAKACRSFLEDWQRLHRELLSKLIEQENNQREIIKSFYGEESCDFIMEILEVSSDIEKGICKKLTDKELTLEELASKVDGIFLGNIIGTLISKKQLLAEIVSWMTAQFCAEGAIALVQRIGIINAREAIKQYHLSENKPQAGNSSFLQSLVNENRLDFISTLWPNPYDTPVEIVNDLAEIALAQPEQIHNLSTTLGFSYIRRILFALLQRKEYSVRLKDFLLSCIQQYGWYGLSPEASGELYQWINEQPELTNIVPRVLACLATEELFDNKKKSVNSLLSIVQQADTIKWPYLNKRQQVFSLLNQGIVNWQDYENDSQEFEHLVYKQFANHEDISENPSEIKKSMWALRAFFNNAEYAFIKNKIFDEIDREIKRLESDSGSFFRKPGQGKAQLLADARQQLIQKMIEVIIDEAQCAAPRINDDSFNEKKMCLSAFSYIDTQRYAYNTLVFGVYNKLRSELSNLSEAKEISGKRNIIAFYLKGLLGVLLAVPVLFSPLVVVTPFVAKRYCTYFFHTTTSAHVKKLGNEVSDERTELKKKPWYLGS